MARLIQLDNGLRIVLDKRDLPTVGIALAVNIGSAYENKDKRGLSHVIEHVIYRAFPDLDLTIEGLGGMSDAYTERTATMYLFDVIPENARNIMKIISYMFNKRKVNDEDLKKEIKVILSELSMRRDDPGTLIYDLGPRALFGDSDYGDPVIGFEETIRSITKYDVEEYLDKYYTPDNMVLAIVGPIDISIEELNEYFGKWYGKSYNRKKPSIGVSSPIVLKQNVNSAYISYSWYVDVMGNEYLSLIKSTLLEFHLIMGLSSYLISRFRNKGLSYTIDVDREYLDNLLLFQVIIPAVNLDDINTIKEELENNLENVKDINKDKEYMARRINYLRYVINDIMKKPLNIAESEAYMELKFNNHDIESLNKALEMHFMDDVHDLIKNGIWSMIIPSY